MINKLDSRPTELSSKNPPIFLGVCEVSSVVLDAFEKSRLSIPGNQQFLSCPGCILTHYIDYVVLEGRSWNSNWESPQSVACHVSPALPDNSVNRVRKDGSIYLN